MSTKRKMSLTRTKSSVIFLEMQCQKHTLRQKKRIQRKYIELLYTISTLFMAYLNRTVMNEEDLTKLKNQIDAVKKVSIFIINARSNTITLLSFCNAMKISLMFMSLWNQ